MTNEIMDLKELAQYLKFSEAKIYRLVGKRQIPFTKIGGQYRFTKKAIDDWLAQGMSEMKIIQEPGVSLVLDKVKAEKDPLKKRLLFVGLLTKELEPYDITITLVGGQAVEFYTLGGYATQDIDLVSDGSTRIGQILEAWGFKKEGRHWYREDLEIALEVPESVLAGDYKKRSEVEIDGLKVYVIGIEDLVIDRLNDAVHLGSTDSLMWAKQILALNREDVDWGYLKAQAEKEKVLEKVIDLEMELRSEKNQLQ